MDDQTIINDYPIQKYKNENIEIINQDQILKQFNHGRIVEIKVIYNNLEKIFCVYSLDKLKKCLYMHFQVPEQNQLLFLNGKYRIINSIDIDIIYKYIKLEYIYDYTKIKIYILYKNNKWLLFVSRISNKYDLLFFLSQNNYFKLNEKEFQVNFKFEGKRVQTLKE